MKHFKYFAFLLAVVASVGFFTSCKDRDDDDDKTNDSSELSIVGTWEINESEGSYYFVETLTFGKNGDWTVKWDEMGYTGTAGGTYIVSGNKLTKIYDWDDDGKNKKGTRYTYTFRMPDNKTLVLIEADGDTSTYMRKR